MARKSSTPKVKKNDMKITMMIVGVLAIVIGIFVFLNRDQKAEVNKIPEKSVQVVRVDKTKATQVTASPVKAQRQSTAVRVATPVSKPKKIVEEAAVLPGSAGKIAFVIDDWGQSMRNCKYLKQIDAPIAVAILPKLPHSDGIAKCAKIYDKTIMLHLPLQAYNNHDPYPTDYIIKTDMKPAKVEKILNDILAKMPYIEGVNNHMGSKATEDKNLMTLIMRRLKKNNLFFVDSMTAPKGSVGSQVAKDVNIVFGKRDVFLDNVNTREGIMSQMQELMNKAKTRGYAIAIGHDRDLTMKIIAEQIPVLRKLGYSIVDVKDLVKSQK